MSDQTQGIRWEDPPAYARGVNSTPWSAETEALKANPGKWALISERPDARSAGALAYNIRRGTTKAFAPAGTFESRAVTAGGRADVYARYVGEVSE